MPADPTENLLFETSPFGTLDGIVEHDGRVVYFYINERQTGERQADDSASGQTGQFGMRACWVRNLDRGPLVLNKAHMNQGMAPIAVIPPWSGVDGFFGYASNCAHESPLAWPMPENKSLQLRIERASEFWSSFTKDSSPFLLLQRELIEAYDNCFGKENQKQYYAIDGGKFPPRGLIRYETKSKTVLLTVGMALCPQPSVELSIESPSELRRIEIGSIVPHVDAETNEENVESAMRSISTWAAYPWRNHAWLGPGHTIDWSASKTKATLLKDESVSLPIFRNDPIHLIMIDPEK